jgi:glutamate decarboxylase
MLGGLALKRRWRKRRLDSGESADRPNLVMGINVQVCWEKLANYWDVEMRLVPMEGERYNLSAEEAVALCDENTIGVVAILGSTFDGSYEPVAEIGAALDDLQERTGLDVPVHVDGASGAFIAPFVDPELEWDFRLPRVASINTSGHKYGLVYPGVGWIVTSYRCSRSRSPTTSRTSRCSTSRVHCASAAGSSPPTPSRRTAPTSPRCASSFGADSPTTWQTCSSRTSAASYRG